LTFIEIGVDYFAHFPGALNKSSRHGKAIHALFTNLDQITFSEDFAEERIGNLPGRLLTTTRETLPENSEFLSEDPKYQKLLAVTSNTLVKAVPRRQDFLIRLPNATLTGAALIDTILSSTLRKKDDKAAWSLVQRGGYNRYHRGGLEPAGIN
jgi:hypothetical protein